MKQTAFTSLFSFIPIIFTSHAALAAPEISRTITGNETLELPEIVVTAELRPASIMHTPNSVSVVTESMINARAAQHFEDVIQGIANVNYAGGTNRARFFQIRGIGERSQFVNPVNPSVGVLIDDVDFSGAGAVATMMDVKQVEVLRGPQGTRYGANALAGLINIETNDPTPEASVDLKISSASYNTETLGLVLNVPLTATVSTRLVAEKHQSDGYIRNDFLNRADTNNRDETTIRGKMIIDASDTWKIDLALAHIDIDDGYDAFSLDNTRHTLSDEPGFDQQQSNYLAIKNTWQRDKYAVELLTNASRSKIGYGYDEDWSYVGIHPFEYSSVDIYLRDRDTQSLELRLVSSDEGRLFADTTDWVVGIYYLNSAEDLQRQYSFIAADFRSQYNFTTRAIFSQLDISLDEKTTLRAGLRLENRRSDYQDNDGVAFSPDDNHWGGRIALERFISDNTMVYASVARGYKAGGFNIDGTLDPDLREFGEEYLIEYEAGFKSSLVDDSLQLRWSFFYDDRQDQQVKSSLVRVRADGSTAFIDFIGNAAKGSNKGVEIDLNWSLNDNFNLSSSLGWLDASFDKFINEFGEDLSGRDQAHAPSYMASVTLDYEGSPWFASVGFDAKDEFYFSDRHSVKSDASLLWHASAGYEGQSWKLTVWGRNLSNKDYYVRAFGSFGNDPRKFYVTEPYFQFGEPRVAGVTLAFNFGD